MNLTAYQKEIYEIAVAKGWHETERSETEYRLLILSELFEAFEEFRDGMSYLYNADERGDILNFDNINQSDIKKSIADWIKRGDSMYKPEGIAIELVDCVIRILDYFESHNFNSKIEKSEHLDTTDFVENIDRIISKIYLSSHKDLSERLIRYKFIISDILVYFQYKNWDFESILKLKIAYNRTRSYRHGGKVL